MQISSSGSGEGARLCHETKDKVLSHSDALGSGVDGGCWPRRETVTKRENSNLHSTPSSRHIGTGLQKRHDGEKNPLVGVYQARTDKRR